VTENIPLAKTLNYFTPVNYGQDSCEIIASQNSDYFIVGKPEGKLRLFNSALKLPHSMELDFFNTDNKKALKKHQVVKKKAEERF